MAKKVKDKSKATHLRPTANDLPQALREEVSALLCARLADATDMRSQVKHAHWNVKGPNFIALHELFDQIVDRIDDQADEIAERAAQLGAIVPGTVRVAAAQSKIEQYPLEIQKSEDHVRALVARMSTYGALIREAIDTSDEAGDAGTADLFTGISREIDKDLWFLEAHLG